MAILRRHKSTVYGLQTDLDNLGTADTTEASARSQAVNTLQTNIDNEATARTTAVSTINTTLSGHTTSIGTLETSMSTVNGDATTAGSIAKAKSDALAYTDTAVTGLAATTYVDTARTTAVSTAQTYTNTRETAITTAYQSYADQAEVDAKAYTDTREAAITTAYQTYANTAESDAVTSANSYTDGKVTIINTSLSGKLVAASNLSDLTNVATARTNLGVYSQAEVQSAIDTAGLNLGTNYSVATVAARNAMVAGSLTVGDNVFVTNDGDTKWAVYKVTAITDGAGSTSTFSKIMDEDVYLNANTASAIKSAYESNDDTNAFTDAEKTSVATSASTLSTVNANSSTAGSFRKGDADTLASAQSYTNTAISGLATTSYVDTAESDAVSTAQTYTNTRETAITTAYQTYADQAETDAKAYTDTRETAITTAYQTYADQAETDAVTSANTYTDGQVTTLNTTIGTKLAKASNLSDLNNVATARTNLGVYSTSQVDTAISNAVAGALSMASENLVVSGDLITLTHNPVNGVVLNFATVRYVDENGNSFDIPVAVTATAGGKEYALNGDSAGQFDTKTIKIQYMYAV